MQVRVAAGEAVHLHQRVAGLRVAEQAERPRGGGDPALQVDHLVGLGGGAALGGARQHQHLPHVLAVALHERRGGGVVAGVEGRVGQPEPALGEVADVPLQVPQVDVGAEVEHHRDPDLVQCGDRRRDVAGTADRVDPLQQRSQRLGAVALDLRLGQPAGPEVAEQLLDLVLRRLHRRVEQRHLLPAHARFQLAQRGDGVHALGQYVVGQPGRVGVPVEVRARLHGVSGEAGEGGEQAGGEGAGDRCTGHARYPVEAARSLFTPPATRRTRHEKGPGSDPRARFGRLPDQPVTR